jgi:3-phosphoshikimate 1-carboxyvinyltransferase
MDFLMRYFQFWEDIHSNNGKLPLRIQGPIIPRTIEIDGSLSSQFLTGLLMAYAASGATGVAIKVKNLRSSLILISPCR